MEKKYEEAQALLEQNVLGEFTQSYLPLGELTLDMVHPEGEIQNYRRSLDLGKALSRLQYSAGKVNYVREMFVSAPDQVMVMHISADRPGMVSLKAGFSCQLRAEVSTEENRMILDGIAPSQVDPSYVDSPDPVIYEEAPEKKGMRFCAVLAIEPVGGEVKRPPGQALTVRSGIRSWRENLIKNLVSGNCLPHRSRGMTGFWNGM